MELLKGWLKDRKEKPSPEQLCEEIAFLIEEKVQVGPVLKSSDPIRILIVDDVLFYDDNAKFSIAVNMPALWGPTLDVYKFDKFHGDWSVRWHVKKDLLKIMIQHSGIESLWYEEIPEEKREKCLSDLLKMIKNSTPGKYV